MDIGGGYPPLSFFKAPLGSCLCNLIRAPNLSRFVEITHDYVELLLQSCQFAECHRTMRFQDTHTSLPITRAEEHKCTRLKVEVGLLLAIEGIQRAEEEHAWLEAE